MKYLVKTTYTATADHPYEAEGTKQVWYTGKGGVVHSTMDAFVNGWGCDGWNRRHFAEKHREDQLEFHYKFSQHEAWDIDIEIIEY